MTADEPRKPGDGEELPRYERPVMPWEREATSGLARGGIGVAGLEFAALVVLFILGGWWADGQLGSSPWLTLLGAVIGVGGGMWRLIRTATAAGRAADAAARARRDGDET